ncbi:DUF600 domain-containing protein [Zophobihabitans entericus]|uniref:DUF600 domain-containing protein n=1 Tax=Zophobihabitans entericus TaxID=1635327 RepID=A0A6G9ID85_9GAMM|nr:DUF600 domain-containing protein [Zophobihabitans entericus]QIQ22195.1 DUF600 domain-containing protein [Zophobihabitans entericus]
MATKTFEDYLLELQTDMVDITLEYAFDKADKIYIYCSCENNTYFFSFFYEINGVTVHKHKLTDLDSNTYDVSINRQKGAVKIGVEDLQKIHQLFNEYQREMPTEMKLIYDVTKNSLAADYSYELKHSNTKNLIAMDIFDQWFDEVAK